MIDERIMSEEQLSSFIGTPRKKSQIEWLKDNGIPFRVKVTGHPCVLWSDVEGRKRVDNGSELWNPKVLAHHGT